MPKGPEGRSKGAAMSLREGRKKRWGDTAEGDSEAAPSGQKGKTQAAGSLVKRPAASSKGPGRDGRMKLVLWRGKRQA